MKIFYEFVTGSDKVTCYDNQKGDHSKPYCPHIKLSQGEKIWIGDIMPTA
jgi:hypothetical protein